MATFLSALELARYLNGTTDPTTLDPAWVAQAGSLIEAISDDIEFDGGVRIEAGAGTVVLAGTYSRDLILPAGAVRAVSTVIVDGTEIAAGGWYWNNRSLIRRGWWPTLGETDDGYDTGRRQGAHGRDGYPWGSPASTIVVDMEWGFTAVPPFVKALTKRVAARTIGNLDDTSQESLGAYSVSHRATGGAGSHLRPDEVLRLRKALIGITGTVQFTGR